MENSILWEERCKALNEYMSLNRYIKCVDGNAMLEEQLDNLATKYDELNEECKARGLHELYNS